MGRSASEQLYRILFFSAMLTGCGANAESLTLPAGLAESRARSAIVFEQSSPIPSATVESARAFDLDAPAAVAIALDEEETLRLVGLPETLEALGLQAGTVASTPDGREITNPTAVFEIAGASGSLTWTSAPLETASQIPWRLPELDRETDCERFVTQAWSLNGLHRVYPHGIIGLDDETLVMLGGRRGADSEVREASLMARVELSAERAQYEELGEAIAGDEIYGAVLLDDHTVFAPTRNGNFIRHDLSTQTETIAVGQLPGVAPWTPSRGDDGTLVVFDRAIVELRLGLREPRRARLVDPETLEVVGLDAPERFQELLVFDRNEMIGAASGRIYLWDGTTWEMTTSLGQLVTGLIRDGDEVFAIVDESSVVRTTRESGWRVWTALPEVPGVFNIEGATPLEGGRLLIGGPAGALAIWDGTAWCNVEPRIVTRGIRALGDVSGPQATGFVATYSESLTDAVTIGRLQRPP